MLSALPNRFTQNTVLVLPRPVKYDDAAVCP